MTSNSTTLGSLVRKVVVYERNLAKLANAKRVTSGNDQECVMDFRGGPNVFVAFAVDACPVGR